MQPVLTTADVNRSAIFPNKYAPKKIVDLLTELKADCPKQRAGNMGNMCAARCPDLVRVM